MNDWDDDYEADDWDDDDEVVLVKCSSCGSEVYEEAEQCPDCGEYIVADTNVWNDKPGWWIALGVAGVIAVIVALA